MYLKNTPVSGLNEVVIDGRLEHPAQWMKSDEYWERYDFADQLLDVIDHTEMMRRVKVYDRSKQFKTWLSGNTLNVVVKKNAYAAYRRDAIDYVRARFKDFSRKSQNVNPRKLKNRLITQDFKLDNRSGHSKFLTDNFR